MRRAIIFSSSFAAIIALAYLSPMFGSSSAQNGNPRGAMCIAGHCCCTGRAEAETLAANGTNAAPGPGTLDPNQFVGPVREAYKYAGQNPALLAQLHCYCGCDKAEGHQSLLDCYRGMHAVRRAKSARARCCWLRRWPSRVRRSIRFATRSAGISRKRIEAGQLNWTVRAICGARYFNHNRFDAFECRSAADSCC